MKTITILFIVTSHAMLGTTGEATGLWLEELSTPYYMFQEQGYEIEIASIKGGEGPIDPRSASEEGMPESVKRFYADEAAMNALKNTVSINEIEPEKYDAIFLPGGHGTMFDFPNNERLAEIIAGAYEGDRVVAAVCHGPAALVGVMKSDGTPLVQGKTLAAFTNAEEDAVELTDAMPFLLQTSLEEAGASHVAAENFQPKAVADGNLITGQNPASSEEAARLVIEALSKAGSQ